MTKRHVRTERVALALSRSMSYVDRAEFIRFAKWATIGHWAEVIGVMSDELVREGRDPATGLLPTQPPRPEGE